MAHEPWTVTGRVILPGRSIPLGYARGRAFDPAEGLGSRLRFVSVGVGAGVFTRDGRSYPFRAPTWFCLDEREAVRLDCSDDTGNLFVYFHPSILRNDLDFGSLRGEGREALPTDAGRDAYWLDPFTVRERPSSGIVVPGIALERRVSRLARDLVREAEEQPTAWWPCRTRSFLIEMLFAILTEAESGGGSLDGFELAEPADGANDGLLARFFMAIGTGYSERLTVQDLARDLGTNRTTLQERVARATGRTVAACIAAVRLDVARALLSDTMLPIDEVAGRAGYADASSFSRAFRNGFGAPPSEYRRAHGHALIAD